MTINDLHAVIDDLFAPVTTYAGAVPAFRNPGDFTATLTLPLDLAAAGFACRVECIPGGGYELTITRPATATMPKVSAVGSGPTWLACCMEVRHELHQWIDRIERDLQRQAKREALAA